MKIPSKIKISDIYIAIILALMYLPILTVIIFSFNKSKLSTVWSGFSLDWYLKLFSNTVMLDALKNSLILAFSSCMLSAIIAVLGAIGIYRSKIIGKKFMESLTLIPIMIPEIILGMIFLSFFSFIGLKFGMLTLIIAHSSFCIPYIFIMVRSSLLSIDKSIEEAGLDLGASNFQIFFDLILPNIMPSIISGTLLAFAMSLDDVVISFFVTGATVNTLPVKIYSQLKVGVTPEVNAICTLMLLITLIIILLSGFARKKEKNRRN